MFGALPLYLLPICSGAPTGLPHNRGSLEGNRRLLGLRLPLWKPLKWQLAEKSSKFRHRAAERLLSPI